MIIDDTTEELGYLLLTRKVKQRIKIGANIYVEIKEIRGNQVKIQIIAPKKINIVREELIKDGN